MPRRGKDALSIRERRIANLRVDGLTIRAIAELVGLSYRGAEEAIHRPRVKAEMERLERLRDTVGVVVRALL